MEVDLFPKSILINFASGLLQEAGASSYHAELAATALVCADARGNAGEGLARLPAFVTDVAKGTVDGQAKPEVVRHTESTALLDGNNSLGVVVATQSMKLAIEMAHRSGIGFVTARRSNHFGEGSRYSQMAANDGLIGIAMTSTPPCMVPTRARGTPVLGSNPIAMAAPVRGRHHFDLDMATSNVTLHNVEELKAVAAELAVAPPMPEGWGVVMDGGSSTSADDVLRAFHAGRGGLHPLGGSEETGGFKGYGLAVMVELLCGVLSGANAGPDVPAAFESSDDSVGRASHAGSASDSDSETAGPPADLGQCFLAIDPEAFGEGFGDRSRRLIEQLLQLEAAVPERPVLVAGDRERQHVRRSRRNGVPLLRATVRALDAVAEGMGLPGLPAHGNGAGSSLSGPCDGPGSKIGLSREQIDGLGLPRASLVTAADSLVSINACDGSACHLVWHFRKRALLWTDSRGRAVTIIPFNVMDSPPADTGAARAVALPVDDEAATDSWVGAAYPLDGGGGICYASSCGLMHLDLELLVAAPICRDEFVPVMVPHGLPARGSGLGRFRCDSAGTMWGVMPHPPLPVDGFVDPVAAVNEYHAATAGSKAHGVYAVSAALGGTPVSGLRDDFIFFGNTLYVLDHHSCHIGSMELSGERREEAIRVAMQSLGMTPSGTIRSPWQESEDLSRCASVASAADASFLGDHIDSVYTSRTHQELSDVLFASLGVPRALALDRNGGLWLVHDSWRAVSAEEAAELAWGKELGADGSCRLCGCARNEPLAEQSGPAACDCGNCIIARHDPTTRRWKVVGRVPAARVSSICFGGKNLNKLLIATYRSAPDLDGPGVESVGGEDDELSDLWILDLALFKFAEDHEVRSLAGVVGKRSDLFRPEKGNEKASRGRALSALKCSADPAFHTVYRQSLCDDHAGKVVIVSGGAHGIGFAICTAFAIAGAAVVVCCDVDDSVAQEMCCLSSGVVVFKKVDFAVAAEVAKAIDEVAARYGRLDVLINNVGIQPAAANRAVHEVSEQAWDFVMNVNVKSCFVASKHAIPHLLRRPKGTAAIINMASIQGLQSQRGVPAYAASKGAILSFTRQVALEYADQGLRVMAVCPGTITTPLVDKLLARAGKNYHTLKQPGLLNGGVGHPHNVADVVVFLCSSAASFMTGEHVVVDGGMMARGGWGT